MKVIKKVLLVLLSVLFLSPVIWMVLCSFFPEEILDNILTEEGSWSFLRLKSLQHLTLGQYRSVLLASPDYTFRFWRSVFLVLPIVLFQIIFAVPAAYGFSQTKNKVLLAIFPLFLVQFMIPVQVAVIPEYLFAQQLNLTDTNWSVWLPGIFSGISIYLLSRRMSRIHQEILEAARIDGAGEIRVLISIAVPLSRAEITACIMLTFIEGWSVVEYPIMMFSNPLDYPLSVYLSKIQEGAAGVSLAASVIYLIPPVLIFLFGEEYLKEGFSTE